MFAATVLFGWAILLTAPATPIGRALHRWTVERPAAWLNRITRGHVALGLVVLGLTLGAFWLEGDAPRILAMALPDLVTWAVMVDVSALIDAAVATTLIASSVRWGAMRTRFSRSSTRPRPRQPRRRHAAPTARKAPANDDDGPGWALAA